MSDSSSLASQFAKTPDARRVFARWWAALTEMWKAVVCKILAVLAAMAIGVSPQACMAATSMTLEPQTKLRVEKIAADEQGPAEEIDFADWAETRPRLPPIWKDGGCVPIFAKAAGGIRAAPGIRNDVGCLPGIRLKVPSAATPSVWKDAGSPAAEGAGEETRTLIMPTRVPVPVAALVSTPTAARDEFSPQPSERDEQDEAAQWVARFCSGDMMAENSALTPLLPSEGHSAREVVSVVGPWRAPFTHQPPAFPHSGRLQHLPEIVSGYIAGAVTGLCNMQTKPALSTVAAAGREVAKADVQRVATRTWHGVSRARDVLLAYMTLTAEALVAYAALSAGRAQAVARTNLKSVRRSLFSPKQYPLGSRGARRQVGRAMYLKMSQEQRQEYRLEMAAHRLLDETTYLGFQSKPDLSATDANLPLSTRVAMARRMVRAKEAALEEDEEAAEAAAFSWQLAQLADPLALRGQRREQGELGDIAWPGEKTTRSHGVNGQLQTLVRGMVVSTRRSFSKSAKSLLPMRSLPVAQQGQLHSPLQSSQRATSSAPSDGAGAGAPNTMVFLGKEVEVRHLLVMAQAGYSLTMMIALYCSGL